MATRQIFHQGLRVHGHFSRAASYFCSPFLLLVRLYWGWQFAQTGWGKLHRLPQVTQYFASLNIPFPAFNAAFVSWLELVGGVLLILGLASRVTALLLAFDMFIAYLAGDPEALRAVISNPGKFYNADPYTFLFASLLILFFGPGKFALDFLLERRARRKLEIPPEAAPRLD